MVADVSKTAIPFIIHDRGWDAGNKSNKKNSLRRLEKKIIRHLLIGYLHAEVQRAREAKRGRIMKDPEEVKEFRQFMMVQYLMVIMEKEEENRRPKKKKKRKTQRMESYYHSSNSPVEVKT